MRRNRVDVVAGQQQGRGDQDADRPAPPDQHQGAEADGEQVGDGVRAGALVADVGQVGGDRGGDHAGHEQAEAEVDHDRR
jgi:hypothetical protein